MKTTCSGNTHWQGATADNGIGQHMEKQAEIFKGR